jgi:hypothetical protein
MSIKNKEYVFSVDKFNKPTNVTGKNAIGTRLMELIMMEPGDDPLHPDMGVGIKRFRYTINTLDQLQTRLQDQINTYLPFYQSVSITIIPTPDKIVNIEITIGDTRYIYDSSVMSKPIVLDDILS